MSALGVARLVALQPDGRGDVVEFCRGNLVEFLAAFLEPLVDLDRLLGHRLVGLLGSAEQGEVRAGGGAFVAIGIEADTKHYRLAAGGRPGGFWHPPKLRSAVGEVKPRPTP